jgi:hypothetical protein
MRFIIREMDYERPLAAGKLLYELHGQPTGTTEEWRLTAAVDGYRFLRIDLDSRQADPHESTLYHLTLNSAGRSERLKFRYFGPDSEIVGDVMLEDDSVTLSRTVNGRRFEDERKMQSGYRFWFPSTLGLSLLTNMNLDEHDFQSATLNGHEAFALDSHEMHLELGIKEHLDTTGQSITAWPCFLIWSDYMQTIWLDSYNLPVKFDRGDGLLAFESRYVRFQDS